MGDFNILVYHAHAKELGQRLTTGRTVQGWNPVTDNRFHFLQNRSVRPKTHPNSHLICSRVPSPWLRWPGHEAEHSTTNVAKVTIEWCYASTLPTCLPEVDRDEFYHEHADVTDSLLQMR
jgi:hypothetical protein